MCMFQKPALENSIDRNPKESFITNNVKRLHVFFKNRKGMLDNSTVSALKDNECNTNIVQI